jgi:Spy/CpxP family protein refolding chaperone
MNLDLYTKDDFRGGLPDMKKMIPMILAGLLVIHTAGLFGQRRDGYGSHHRGAGPGNRRMGGWFWNQEMLDNLGVSAQVRKEIYSIITRIRNEAMDYQLKIREKRVEIRKEYYQSYLDEKKIKALMKEVAELKSRQQYAVDLQKLEIMKLLTAEQRQRLYRHLLERRKRFWRHMHE